MKKYIVIYSAPKSAMEKMKNMSSEDNKKGMEPWMAWVKKCGTGVVDMGAPLGNGKSVNNTGTRPSNSEVAGYSILQAQNVDEAVNMLKDHPHLSWDSGCSIEVFEAMPMSG